MSNEKIILDLMAENLQKEDHIATLNETITELQKEIEVLKSKCICKTCNCHKSPTTLKYEVHSK
jgi:hypothetical protein